MENIKKGFSKNAKEVLKGVFIGTLISLFCVLILALILRFTSLSNGAIKPINQGIKIISIFLGCLFGVKGEKGYIKGLIVGELYVLVTFLLFSALSSNFAFGLSFLWDLIFSAIIGFICGAIVVNLKK